jgi:dolichol kinase
MYGACRNVLLTGQSLLVLPLHHIFGLVASVFAVMFYGQPIYINKSLKRLVSDFQKCQPQHLFAVPLIVETLHKNIWATAKKQGKDKALHTLIKVSDALLKCKIDLRKVFFKSVIAAFGGNLDLIVSGGAPVYAAAALTCLFFVPLCAAAGMAVLMTADAAAALIGRKFGKHKLVNGKSLEGTLAFVLTGVLATGVCISAVGVSSLLPYVLPAVILAALAELFQKQLKVDDNFSIPLVTAGFLQLALLFH